MTRRRSTVAPDLLLVVSSKRRKAHTAHRVGAAVRIARHTVKPDGSLVSRPSATVTLTETEFLAIADAIRVASRDGGHDG